MATTPDGKSKGYGFVHFESNESATKAIETVNGMLLADRKVFVGPFIKKTERPSDKDSKFTNVFFKNLGTEIEEKQLQEMVAKFGEITSAKVRGREGKRSDELGRHMQCSARCKESGSGAASERAFGLRCRRPAARARRAFRERC